MQTKRAKPLALLPILALSVVILANAGSGADKEAEKPVPVALTGSVWDEESNPITNATVVVYTAKPRRGVGSICPSCYPDCQKKTRTDSEGKFTIASVDPALLFNVLVLAKGYESTFVDKVDTSIGPIDVGLRKNEPVDPAAGKQVQGRIVDPFGKPVMGAKVEADSLTHNNGTRWGAIRGAGRKAITDENGQFTLSTTEPFDSMGIIIEARGLAKLRKNGLVSSKGHFIKMKQGTSITGRMLRDGNPFGNIPIAASGTRRWAGESVGEFEIGTDEAGRFKFVNLPAETDYSVFGKMKALKELGAINGRPARSGPDGSTIDIGDLHVQPGRRLAGFVTVTGDELFPGAKMNVSREDAGDSLSVNLDDDGAFDLRGIPEEAISIHVRMPGYRLSAKNPNLDRLNPWRLMGRVDRDIVDLQILFEPGKDYQHGDPALSNLPGPDQPRDVPLRGVPIKAE